MKILITGICGFVGSSLAKSLRAQSANFEIFGIDNFVRPGSQLNRDILVRLGIKVFHADIREMADLEFLPKADWVIDAAANPSVLAGVDGKTSSLQLIQNNLYGTINLLELCKRNQSGFILLSTSRVYSIADLSGIKMEVVSNAFLPAKDQQFPIGVSLRGVSEQFSTSPPVSLYGSTKVTSEHLALEYGETFGFPVWINRCGVLAGAGQFGHAQQGIFSYWIHSFRERRPLKYIGFNGTGYQVRDCLHPRDLTSLLLQQFREPLTTKKRRTVNVSGGTANSCSLQQLTQWCESRFQRMTIEVIRDNRPFDIPWMVLDHSYASECWNWNPETSLEAILEEISKFADANDNWIEISQSK